MLDLNAIPALSPGYRMQWEEVQNCHVVLYPEGMVQLNEAASAILEKCDGQRSLNDVIQTLQEEFDESDLKDDIVEFMNDAIERGWIRLG